VGAAILGVAVRLAIFSLVLAGCTHSNTRCFFPPEHDVFMTRCLMHLKFDDCEANAAIQGMGLRCVERGQEQGSTSHYSVAGQ
jgi:hypothetical protein